MVFQGYTSFGSYRRFFRSRFFSASSKQKHQAAKNESDARKHSYHDSCPDRYIIQFVEDAHASVLGISRAKVFRFVVAIVARALANLWPGFAIEHGDAIFGPRTFGRSRTCGFVWSDLRDRYHVRDRFRGHSSDRDDFRGRGHIRGGGGDRFLIRAILPVSDLARTSP